MPRDLHEVQATLILANTYHLHLRRVTNWSVTWADYTVYAMARPILTDSGGYQVFSLTEINQIDDDGVTFRSHIDGSKRRLTPKAPCISNRIWVQTLLWLSINARNRVTGLK